MEASSSHRPARVESLESRQLLSAVGIFTNDTDIGAPALSGTATFSAGIYSVSGSGSDIGSNSDQFNFAYSPLSGDGTLIARVDSLTNTGASAKAGVMVRSSTAANAAFAGLFETPSSGLAFVYRTSDGGSAGLSILSGFAAPRYVELARSGNALSAYYSADAVTWTQAGSTTTVSLGAAPLAGLAVTSANGAAVSTAAFSHVSLLPPNWSDSDIGSPSVSSTSTYNLSSNQFIVDGSGTDIGGTSDQFSFVSQKLTGDGSIVAQIGQLSASDPIARAGLVIRDSTSTSAMFAAITRSVDNTLSFQWRSTTGGAANSSSIAIGSSALWLRVSAAGTTFSASYSSDRINWTSLGSSQTISMSSAITLAGMAVTSHDNSSVHNAVFTGMTLARGGWIDNDLGAPSLTGSAVYNSANDTYTVVGSGSDIYGTSDQFNFASQALSGDGNVIAYVDSLSDTSPFAKAGVMVRRNATDAAAAFAGLFVSAENGIFFEWRTADGAAVQQEASTPAGGPTLAPVGLKLVRSGNSFSGYYSTDGSTWLLVGPAQTVTLSTAAAAGVAVTAHNDGVACSADFTGVYVGTAPSPGAGVYSESDQAFLDDLENREVNFFYNETNASTGLIPDSALANGGSSGSSASIASIGFGLSALTIGDARGYLSHANAYQRALTTINFLYNTVPNVNGFYYHFLNPATGARAGTSELSSVDTAELMAGVMNVAAYWPGTALATTAQNMFNRVNWPWMQRSNGHFYGAWTPESGFSGEYGDFSEAAVLYLLALGSSTHPITYASWLSWSRTPVVNYSSYRFVTADDAALFTVQYPQAWYDLRGLSDSTGLNYYTNAQTATLAQRQWMATTLSSSYSDYNLNIWGLTASDSANGYAVWGGPPANGPINGTVVPTAPGGSLAFTPRQSVDSLRAMAKTYPLSYKKYGSIDSFNPLTNFYSQLVLGIDAGMMLVAAENSRSALVWNSFGQSSVARQSEAIAFPSVTPQLSSAVSRKNYGVSSHADIGLNLTGTPSTDGRLGGPTELVLTFANSVVQGSNFHVTLATRSGQSDGTVDTTSLNGSTLTIDLGGTLNGQAVVVTVSDIRNFATSSGGTYSFAINVLAGDVNGDGAVNIADLGTLATSYGSHVSNWTGADFNGDGVVDIADLGTLATDYGQSVASSIASISQAYSAPAAPVQPSKRHHTTISDEVLV